MLTAERLREVLSYDPNTGVWTWVKPLSNSVRRGQVAGQQTRPDGYIRITVDSRVYAANVLAWFWMVGVWPSGDVDHRNLDRRDNRWSNLRNASRSQNRANASANSNNTSGFKGVSWHRHVRKWQARIGLSGRRISLGYFTSASAAHDAYCRAASVYFGEFARG